MLSREDKVQILKRFPEVELSYDKILHKKVHADLFMIQPKGKRAFLWFTYFRNLNVCIVLELNKNGNVSNLNILNACFDSDLSYGTLLHGTYFSINKTNYFSSEDVLYYKSEDVSSKPLHEKLRIMKTMFQKDISQKSYNKNFVIIGLPCWCQNNDVALTTIRTLPYQVYGIRLYNSKKMYNEFSGILLNKSKKIVEGIFRVKASLQPDVYHLFCFDHNGNSKYSTAAVPSYKRSVALNNIFRIIKENHNLDLLEQSDDEDEFENTNEDKYVNLDKYVTMKCVYNKRFRKWEPIDVIEQQARLKLITRNEAQSLERNH